MQAPAASLQLLRGLGSCFAAADSRAPAVLQCLRHCSPCAQPARALRHATGAASSPATPRARPVLKDLASVPQLGRLNDELADAVRADRESARRSLYDSLPATLAAMSGGATTTSTQNPVRLTEGALAGLEVRSPPFVCIMARSVHARALHSVQAFAQTATHAPPPQLCPRRAG